MLILAGVSINAIVGEDGVISKAQGATYTQSRAVLEEYLNQYYVEHYDDFEDVENKAVALKNYSKSAGWFYQGAPLGYVVDSDGNSHYFINVNGLPDELKSSIKGGNANGKETLTYQDYAKMEDVYGITSDLKVYYCSTGKDSISGVTLDVADTTKEVFAAGSNMAKLISGSNDKSVTLEDCKTIKKLTIDNTSGITSLRDLYSLPSLKELKIENVSFESLEGIENALNLNYLYLYNCNINDYKGLDNINNKLEYLYLVNTKNEELNKLVDKMKNVDFPKLNYFGIYESSNVTDISRISELSDTTKKAVKYLYLQYNQLTNVDAIKDFTNVIYLYVYGNGIVSLNTACSNMSSLYRLDAYSNNLGANESVDSSNLSTDSLGFLSNCKNIGYMDLRWNNSLKRAEYISNSTNLKNLYLENCSSLLNESVVAIRDVYNNCYQATIDAKYKILLNTAERLDYKGLGLNDSSIEIDGLINNTTVKELRLDGSTNLTNNKIESVLSGCTHITTLSLVNISNLTSLNFVENMPDLVELDLRGTRVTDLSKLENCEKMTTLLVDNENIDLTKIQKTISRLGQSTNYKTFLTDNSTESSNSSFRRGFLCYNYELLSKLSQCTDITKLFIADRVKYTDYSSLGTIDLSNTKIKHLEIDFYSCNLKLPNTIKYLWTNQKCVYELSSGTQLTNGFQNYSCQTNDLLKLWCEQLKKCSYIETFIIYGRHITDFSSIDLLKNSNLQTIGLANWGTPNLVATSLKGLENITTLKTLDASNISNLVDISALENLVNLTTLNLKNDSVTNLYYIRNCNRLTSLNLSNNNIYDTVTFNDIDSSKKTVNNLEILANLNKNGALRKLYLAGNSGIIDWTPVSSITNWVEKSGW